MLYKDGDFLVENESHLVTNLRMKYFDESFSKHFTNSDHRYFALLQYTF